MDRQLWQYMNGINQVTKTLNTLLITSTEISSARADQDCFLPLHESKYKLVEAVLQFYLNGTNPLTTSSVDIGDIVLAPRLYANGLLDLDLALVIDIIEDVDENEEDDADVDNDVVNENVKYLWLRPQSLYEYFSCGNMIPLHAIRKNGLAFFHQQVKGLADLRIGDDVIVAVHCNRHVWVRGVVLNINDYRGTVDIRICDSHKGRRFGDQGKQISCELDESVGCVPVSSESCADQIDIVSRLTSDTIRCPMSVSYVVSANTRPRANSEIHATHVKSEVDDDNDDDSAQTTRFTGYNAPQASFPCSMLKDKRAKDGCTPKPNSESLLGLGAWECHTKGIGSKLLLKMGYRRGTGLGKDGSGIVNPIEGLAKALPPGLSLDFLHQVKRGTDGSVILDGEDALASRVRAALQATDRQQLSNKSGKYNEQKNVTVFEFMNTMRTSEVLQEEKLKIQIQQANQARKLEVQKNLQGSNKKIKSIF